MGANTGQSVKRFRELLPGCEIHSFEPSPAVYAHLVKNAGGYAEVYLNNLALGAAREELTLLENSSDDMTSFLRPGPDAWGEVVRETRVPVSTVDDYCAGKGIAHINLLKTDTQGYDLEVIKGAEQMIRNDRVKLVFMEVIFSELYEGAPPFDEVYRHMIDRDFKLVSFYGFNFEGGDTLLWADALFLNEGFRDR